MTITAGQTALIKTIAAAVGRPVIGLPNGPVPPFSDSVQVRWVIQLAGGAQNRAGVDGKTDGRPEINVRVEVPADSYSVDCASSVDDLCALFPVGQTVNGIKIDMAPMPRAPMQDSASYAIPVIIRGRSFF